ncbi:enoyl-(Acyl carrier protein) reductase domain-containing protein [Sarocladium implicatum]|nr:enoyl-(Acyl carrier protein) reductase domain-containing protein [Sarocladium implicatum]
MSLPRKTVTDIHWNSAVSPAQTMILIKAQASSHNVNHLGPDGGKFRPKRWLKEPRPSYRGRNRRLAASQFRHGIPRLLRSIVADEDYLPNTGYVDYNQLEMALGGDSKEVQGEVNSKRSGDDGRMYRCGGGENEEALRRGGLVANGAKVYVVALGFFEEEVQALNELGKESGGTAHGLTCDVSDKSAIEGLAEYIKKREDHVDMLISNASIRRDPPASCDVLKASLSELQASMWSSPHTDWIDTFKVNTTAHYFLSVAFLSLLEAAASMDVGDGRRGRSEGRGVVLMMSSCASMHSATNVDLTSYATSKAATDHLVKLLAAKFSRFYVRVVGVNPGFVPSNMNPVGQAGSNFSNLFDKVPAKRAGGEEDLVGTILYLVSRAGAYVDGVNLCVDGGHVLLANGQE